MKKITKQLILTLMVGVLTLGSLGVLHSFKAVPDVDAANYENLSPTIALTTAYYDAYRDYDNSKDSNTEAAKILNFQNNIKKILGSGNKQFGNVGLLIGPRAESGQGSASDMLSNTNSLSEKQISDGSIFPKDPAEKYLAFGLAVHNLSDDGAKMSTNDARIEESIDGIANTARKMSGIGMQLLSNYNPAPVVEAFYDASALTDPKYEDNKVIGMVNRSDALHGMISLMGSPIGDSRIPGSPSLTLVIFAVSILVLLLGSVVMTLMSGRGAGEGIRKIMIRLIVAAIGIPLIVSALNGGITWAADLSETVDEESSIAVIQDHLNLADWYTLGFPIPVGETIKIDANNEFVLTPDQVQKINNMTYKQITGEEPTSTAVKDRLTSMSRAGTNRTEVIFHKPVATDGVSWDTKYVYEAADKLSLNDGGDPVEITRGTKGYEYFDGGSTSMAKSGTGYNLTNAGGIDGFGISPIAAFNLMNSSFSQNGISAKRFGGEHITTVAQYVSKGAPTDEGMKKLNPLVNVIATFTMVMAALQGMFSILTNGFGGVVSGGAKTVMGSSSGMGQAFGGAVALIGGLFGISIIMSVSFGLLGELQALITDLFSSTQGGIIDTAMDPIREFFKGIPWIGGMLARAAAHITSFIVTIMGALAIPKFGAIPIRVFSEKMAELPAYMADRAQRIENKFTGDYHAGGGARLGGGGGGGAGSISQQMGSAMQAGKGAGFALAGAGLGAAASLAGAGLTKWGDKSEGNDSDSSTLVDGDDNDNLEVVEGGNEQVPEKTPDDIKRDEEEARKAEEAKRAQEEKDTQEPTGPEETPTVPVDPETEGTLTPPITENTELGDITEVEESSLEEGGVDLNTEGGTTLNELDETKQSGDTNVDDTKVDLGGNHTEGDNSLVDGKGGNTGGSGGNDTLVKQDGDTVGGDTNLGNNNSSNTSLRKDGDKSGTKSGKGGSSESKKAPNKISQAFSKAKSMDAKDWATVAGKGLTAAGGHKDGKGVAKQVFGGVIHSAASAAGHGDVTEKMYNRAMNKKDMAKDGAKKDKAKGNKPTLAQQQAQNRQATSDRENMIRHYQSLEDDRNKR